MNRDNARFAALLAPFARDVAQVTAQFSVGRPVLATARYAEVFARNRAEDAAADRSDYSKAAQVRAYRASVRAKR